MTQTERSRAGVRELGDEAMKTRHAGRLSSEIYRAFCTAEENADDTMLELGYKSWHDVQEESDKWVGFFFASLECVLCDAQNPHVRGWFERRGIRG